jgi:membrane associated rhomboid family serine protease
MKVTYLLVLISIIVFFYTAFASDPESIFAAYGFSGANVVANPLTAVTAIFLHGSLIHLLSNVLVWLFVGHAVEDEIGKGKMLLLFFLGAFAGEGLSLLGYPFDAISIGASAGIFALVGAGMLLRPIDLSLYPFIVPIPLALLGLFYAVYNVYEFVFAPDPTISYLGHFGGLAVGLLFGFKYGGLKRGLKIIFVTLGVMILIPLVWLLIRGYL